MEGPGGTIRTYEGTQLDKKLPSLFGEQLHGDVEVARNGEASTNEKQTSSTKNDIRHLGSKFKRLIGSDHTRSASDEREDGRGTVQPDTAFYPARLNRELGLQPEESKGVGSWTKHALSTTASVLTHPRRTVKNKAKRIAAGQLSSTQRPFASQKAELEYLEAQEAISRSDASQSSSRASWNEGAEPFDKGKLLQERRDSVRAAWITSHLRRVRVVPKSYLKFPKKSNFEERDEHGKVKQLHWQKWVGNLLLYYTQNFSAQYVDDFEELPFDLDTFRTYAERLVMETGHWQTWAMKVRSIYRWENPAKTGKWLALYVVLWYTNHIVVFVYGYIIYCVVLNKYYPSSLRNLQDSEQRAADEDSTAFQLAELIERHGPGEWLDPLVEGLGPFAQLQLGDIANILEVLHNFYSWKSPWKTIWTLCFLAVCFLLALLTSQEYCAKIIWFIIGGAFFFCWPIASRYPQYRYLVSPIKWVLWDIPTHTEWSFQYLREQGQSTREAIIERKVEEKFAKESEGHIRDHYEGQRKPPHSRLSLDGINDNLSVASSESEGWASATSASSILSKDDIIGFRAHWNGIPGRLNIYSSGLYFVRSFPRQHMWDVPFTRLEEIWKEKGDKHRKPTLQGLQDTGNLHLKTIDGDVWTLNPMKDRDEAFNAILGISGLKWQSLQTEPGKGRKLETGSSTLGTSWI